MKKTTLLLFMLLALAAPTMLNAQTFSGGNGTEGNPYKIGNLNDWNELADRVNGSNGYTANSFSNKYFILTGDISTVDANHMVGTINSSKDPEYYFSGTFDGKGHTVNINVENQKRFAAPFRCVNNATIKNLHTTGTIDGENGSSNDGKLLAGVVGASKGTTTITGCSSSATIQTTHGADAALAGIVAGYYEGTLTVEGCVFTGVLSDATSNQDHRCGGLVGYQYSGNCTVKNSLFAPTSLGLHSNENNMSSPIIRIKSGGNTPTIQNCYYTTNLGTNNSNTTKVCTIKGGNNVTVVMNGTPSITDYDDIDFYFYNNNRISYGTGSNTKIYAPSSSSVSLLLSYTQTGYQVNSYTTSSGSLSGSATTGTNDDYTLTTPTLSSNSNNVIVTINANVTEVSAVTANGTNMTWSEFASSVNGGTSYSGQTVTLNKDIEVTTMVGTESHPFCGTFDGQGNTLTVKITSNETGAAPFSWISGATIQNLKVTGTVSSSAHHASGLVGFTSGGTNTLENCLVSTSVECTASHIGGIIGHGKSATIIMRGCVFNGYLSATASSWDTWVGGLLGWCDGGSMTFNNCFIDCTYSNVVKNFHPIGCKDTGANPALSMSNCYYLTDIYSNPDECGHANDFMNNNYSYCLPYNYNGDKGKHAYSITGIGVDVTIAGTETTYGGNNVTHYITGYSTGIKYNDVLYAGQSDNVSLGLSNSTTGRYYASNGTLSGSTLNMPAEDVVIRDAKILKNTEGNTWSTPSHWVPSGVPGSTDYVSISYDVTIPANCVAEAEHINVTNNANLTIADGGQLKHNNIGVEATMQKSITGYTETTGKDNYYLMALPFTSYTVGSQLATTGYNLYTFDGSQSQEEWRWSPETLANGQGFLYANTAGGTLSLSGILVPYNDNLAKTVSLNYDATTTFGKWNLVGNPFACNVTSSITDYYVIDKNNTDPNADLIAASGVITPLQGIFVQATGSNQSVIFTPTVAAANSNNSSVNLYLRPADTRDAKIIDVARVRFDEGEGLPKFQLDPNHAKVYIPQNGTDYAVVHSEAQGELPVNFKAENNGQYTISAELTDVEMDYLHLIDNMTGADVDLLANPNYTFNAKTTDYASRFKLVFAATGIEENGASTPSTGSGTEGSATFAYNNGSEWVINNPSTGSGSATLQVIDMTGRVLSSETINGATTKAINAAQGIYMLRLINGENVRVQKVVVR